MSRKKGRPKPGNEREGRKDAALVKDLRQRKNALFADYSKGWKSTHQDVRDYLIPRRGFFEGQEPNDGSKRTNKIMDPRATRFGLNLAALIMGGLTSPSRPWFKLGLPASLKDQEDDPEVKKYLDMVEKAQYQAFAKSNFYDSLYTTYIEDVFFNTSGFCMESDHERYIRCRTFTAGEYAFSCDHSGRPDGMIRSTWMRAKSIEKRFGLAGASQAIKTSVRDNPYKKHKLSHFMLPREDFDLQGVTFRDMPYVSYWIEDAGNEDMLLGEGGFRTKPFIITRWDTTESDDWGRGPGIDLLPDVKMLQLLVRDWSKAVHKVLDPPTLVPRTFKDRLDTLPGAQNYGDDQIRALYQINPDLKAIGDRIIDCREALRDGFFNDIFIFLLEHPNATATEIVERNEEKLILLGPIITRIMGEKLDLIIDRCFDILNDDLILPPPPKQLQGVDLRVEYISLLAQAQKLMGTTAITRAVQFGLGVAGAVPGALENPLDNLDLDEAVRQHADLVGAPIALVKPKKVVKQIRADRAKAQAQANKLAIQSELLKEGPKAAKALSETDTKGKNALTDLTGGAEQ